MTRWSSPDEQLRADRRIIVQVALLAGFILVVIAASSQAYGVIPGPDVTLETVEPTEPSEAYYGPAPDTSAIARVCCRVVGR